jgi:hypothetical protein
MRSLPVPLNRRKAMQSETEIALLLASVKSSAISFLCCLKVDR